MCQISQSVIFYCFFHSGAYLQQSMGGRRGTNWTGRQSIAGQHRQEKQPAHTQSRLRAILTKPINLTVMFLDCGRKPEYPERTHACMGENVQAPCRKTPGRESNPGPS
ncbi:hypothetical protein ATANTOWER_027203 [Ataeniobius toweri]|uniref:Secreted protein n=1 Tax=Ataeniobius toweri TaxID=208326 RepID=A0ABU7BA61_9TELE|nr:hypothetical protein [Ataeniobius toweri]